MLRYLRSPELAFWAAAVAVLGVVLVLASTLATSPAPGGSPREVIGVVGPTSSQAKANVDNLLALMPAGVAAGSEPAALTGFSQSVAEQARQGVSVRRDEGAGSDDVLLRGLERTLTDAQGLAARANDPVSARSARTAIGLDVDHLKRVVNGQPAPELPVSAVDPLGASGTPEVPALPSRPTVPTLPEVSK